MASGTVVGVGRPPSFRLPTANSSPFTVTIDPLPFFRLDEHNEAGAGYDQPAAEAKT